MNYKYNKNNSSIYGQNEIEKEKIRIMVHKLIDYHTLDTICKEYQFSDIDKKCIRSIMDKKIDLIKIRKEKAVGIINIFN